MLPKVVFIAIRNNQEMPNKHQIQSVVGEECQWQGITIMIHRTS
jgi:hypothetical protein